MKRPLDLRHVVSPALRDLIELAHLEDFDRVTEQVRNVRGCIRPGNLVGHTATLDATTRTVVRAYSTVDEPTGRLLTTCGNRRASRCPACSRVYAADTYHLIKAGLNGGKAVANTVRTQPASSSPSPPPPSAPSTTVPPHPPARRWAVGAVGTMPRTTPVLGTPLDPAAYDYTGAVLRNAHAGALWARFTIYLRRELAAELDITQKALKAALRISFAKVAEYQKRGLVHFHAVIRLDGPEGHTTTPPSWATLDALDHAVRAAARRALLTIESDAVGERVIAWGDRIDVREIKALGDGEFTDQKVAAYVAKYATKSAEGSGTVDRTLICRPCAGRGYTHGPDGFRDLCADCDGTGQAEPLRELQVQWHVRQMIRTAWALGHLPEFADLKLWKWAHMLGFRGHFWTKSRAYSTTLGALCDVRRAWRTAQAETARARAGHPAPDENITLVTESFWAYLASGYRPGEELLANQLRHDLAHAERLKTEGNSWQ